MRKTVFALAFLFSLVLAAAAQAAPGGSWGPTFNEPYNYSIHAVVMPTGKVLTWSYPLGKTPYTGEIGAGSAVATVWDPTKGTGADAFKQVSPPNNSNIWCSGQSLMADGRVLVTGGNERYSQDLNNDGDLDDPGEWHIGSKHTFIFDPKTETWEKGPDMAHGRWYPTQTLLPNGDTLIMSGLTEHGDRDNNPDVEIFHPTGITGTLTKIGTRLDGIGGADPIAVPGVTVPPNGDAYPHVFANILGRTVVVGPRGRDSWTLPMQPSTANWTATDWTDLPDDVTRYAGTAVIDPYVDTHIHSIGGSDGGGGADTTPLSSSTETDVAAGTIAPDPLMELKIGRAHHNTVLLPDRSMVTLGGGVGLDNGLGADGVRGTADDRRGQWEARDEGTTTGHSRRAIEIFGASGWKLGPAQAEDRAYHSVGFLLPDGRVFSGGDDVNGGTGDGIDPTHDTGQIYTPEYLDGVTSRPEFTRAPQGMVTGKSYEFSTSKPIASAILMAPSAVTHSNDMNQRVVAVNIVGGKLEVPKIPVPGYYMLFGKDAAGVPTHATWVRLGTDIPAAPVVTPPKPTPTPTPKPTPKPPPTKPGGPFVPPTANPPIRKYGTYDLRRAPLLNDCGNLNFKRYEFMTLKTKKSITAFNVKIYRGATCKAALLLIMDKHLKGYKSGNRKARGYSCRSYSAKNRSISTTRRIRTISCKKVRGRAKVRWQVTTSRFSTRG